MEFSSLGLISPGLHRMDMSDFKQQFVDNFTVSRTRTGIFNSFLMWKDNLIRNYRIHEIWVDGSFVTNKINPNDIDVIVYVYATDYLKLSKNWKSIRSAKNIDAYMTLAICEENEKCVDPKEYYAFVNHRNYWRGQFGFDRNDNPKGIIILDCEEEGGDS